MPTNPEELHAQSTEVLPKPHMEALQQRTAPSSPPAHETHQEADSVETRVDEAPMVRYAIGKLRDFLQWFMLVLEVVLALRVFFKLISASDTNLFAGLLYSLTDIVLFPFARIVNTPPQFAADALIAMLIYWLLFVAVERFLHILITGPEEPTT